MKMFLNAVWDILEEIGKARAQNRIKFGYY
jgi:hypothetical protein